MHILCACEESQAVTIELRKLGHKAFSCDLQECSGGHPEWHIQCDVLDILNPRPTPEGFCIVFTTTDGVTRKMLGRWDAIIAFPPCTDIASSGARHFAKKRADGRQRKSILFFCQMLSANADIVVVENPVGVISGDYVRQYYPDIAERYGLPRKPTQIIQPYFFGDKSRKTTCLWIKGDLPLLQPTDIVKPDLITYNCKGGKKKTYSADYGGSDKMHGKRRSKTYPGIAHAMATQWFGNK